MICVDIIMVKMFEDYCISPYNYIWNSISRIVLEAFYSHPRELIQRRLAVCTLLYIISCLAKHMVSTVSFDHLLWKVCCIYGNMSQQVFTVLLIQYYTVKPHKNQTGCW